MVIPIAAAVTAVTAVLSLQTTIIPLLTNTGSMSLIAGANVAFVIGLFLLNPAFPEKSVELKINIIVAIFASAGLFLVSMVILVVSRPKTFWLYLQILQTTLSRSSGIVFLYLGRRKLSRIE